MVLPRSTRGGTWLSRPGVVLAAIMALSVSPFFFGCSSAEPEIMQTDLRIVATLNPASGAIMEELLLLVDVFDPDGVEDVGEIRLAHDGERVVWRASADTLPRRSRDGQEWFVLSAAPMPGVATVPRGMYRVEVDDLSQRQAVRRETIPLNVPPTSLDEFPAFDRLDIVIPTGVPVLMIMHATGDSTVQYYRVDGMPSEAHRVPADALPPPVRQAVSPESQVSDTDQTQETGAVWLVHEVNRNLIRRSGPWR